ncbi:MAG: hypothetical protein JWN65_3426 [Solirubrobacterales bacterium]|nr:hypothetical protein [Solirubrobacterales bacterium]
MKPVEPKKAMRVVRGPATPARAPGGPRRLGLPVPVQVTVGPGGRPLTVAGDPVDAVRESWLVEDRWWTAQPLRRRYWEVVTTGGRDLVLFRDLEAGGWYRQR